MSDPSITVALAKLHAGEEGAEARLFQLVYAELRRYAASRLAKLPPGQTLQPTALVHEAFLKLVGSQTPYASSRAHFFSAAGRAMRNVLVDRARQKASVKQGGGVDRVELEAADFAPPGKDRSAAHVLDVDEALARLEKLDERTARIVEMRFFAGFDESETAAALDISERTVRRDWAYAKAWLRRELAAHDADFRM